MPTESSQAELPKKSGLQGFIFDLGRVLVTWDQCRIWEQIITDKQELQQHLQFFRPFLYLGDSGMSWPLMVDVLSAAMPEKAPLFRFWWEHWPDALEGEIEGSVAIVQELKALGYPLYILSNFSLEAMERVEHRIPCLALFDGKLISAAERMVKPQPQIFERCVEMFGLRQHGVQNYLFIDDLADNIAAAQQAGLQGHLFSSSENLRLDLVQRGILN